MAVYGCYRGYSSQLCTLGVAITHELGSLIKLPAYWDCTNKKKKALLNSKILGTFTKQLEGWEHQEDSIRS